MVETAKALEELIRIRIDERGWLPFDEYMDLCLYHPQYGYYMQNRRRIGREGDFFTSSSVHSLFGRLIGRQLVEMWELLGKGPFVIAEQGAGEGHLALDVLDALKEELPEFYQQLTYILIEISPDNRQRQAQLLDGHVNRVEWKAYDALQPFTGCLLSNELLDAFPVRRGVWQDDGPHELQVVIKDGALVEQASCEIDVEMVRHFDWLGVVPGLGNRFEVNHNALGWIRHIAGLLQCGFVLTIDYGYPAREYYAAWRRDGTLMCYQQHQSSDDPFQEPGGRDLTAHVDFTALQKAGNESGLETVYFGEQYRFLLGLGFVEALVELQARETDPKRAQALRMTLKNLILPDGGMGEVFKVLIQGKGVGRPQLACSRAIRDLPIPGM